MGGNLVRLATLCLLIKLILFSKRFVAFQSDAGSCSDALNFLNSTEHVCIFKVIAMRVEVYVQSLRAIC